MDGLTLLAAVASTAISAGPPDRSAWIVEGFIGPSITPLFASYDRRLTGGVGLYYARPEKRFRLAHMNGELIVGAYYANSHSNGVDNDPPVTTHAFGALAFGRWKFAADERSYVYADVGWGLQMASRSTTELDSTLNSTPFVGLGVGIDARGSEVLLGARFIHLSNGNTTGRNIGQNQLWFTLGFKF